MSCSTCTKTKTLPHCTAALVIGTITADTPVTVVLRNLAIGFNHFFNVVSANNGLLTIPLADQLFAANQDYELEVWQRNFSDTLPVTIGSDVLTCLLIRFERVFNATGTLSLETATLTLPE